MVDDLTSASEPTHLLAIYPFLELSLFHITWEYGPVVAHGLAPEVDVGAPVPPVWPTTVPSECEQLEVLAEEYFRDHVESANAIAPLEILDVEPMSDDLERAMNTLVVSPCPPERLRLAVLDGLSHADTVSFLAILTRWGAVGSMRDALALSVIGEDQLAIEPDRRRQQLALS